MLWIMSPFLRPAFSKRLSGTIENILNPSATPPVKLGTSRACVRSLFMSCVAACTLSLSTTKVVGDGCATSEAGEGGGGGEVLLCCCCLLSPEFYLFCPAIPGYCNPVSMDSQKFYIGCNRII